MQTVEEIKNVIAGAEIAICSRTEVMRHIYQAHEYVLDYTDNKIKELGLRTATVRDGTSNYVENYLASKNKKLEPHNERANLAMLKFSKIEEEIETLEKTFTSTKDINRKTKLNKMLELKILELKHVKKIQEQTANVMLEAQDKVDAIIPLVSEAWNPTKKLVFLPFKLSVFIYLIYLQQVLLRIFPVVASLIITITIDSWTTTFDRIFMYVNTTRYHSLALLVLFSIQYITFDKLKEVLNNYLLVKTISRISKAFSKNLSVMEAAEKELAYAEAALLSLPSVK